ncbi:PucR family transcriptional regulator [Rhodococcus pyridinivorans]|uniref:PucR family transcriptional regulator n=1 Tax=Rhodococcus pyridinivorans TaxID=103816 RepID=UPI002283CEC0|nr:helix-turn-helix domain-containing protein [Rhodococcus pyridinivorans]WAL49310.1 helix-turn-helix domain-containing protein [Rhodococcus pyridinivorans]
MPVFERLDPEAQAAAQKVAIALLPDLPSIGLGAAVYTREHIPEFNHPDVAEISLAACQANSNVLLDALIRGVSVEAMTPSPEVLQSTRDMVRAQVSNELLMRGYQIGIMYWCHRWSQAVRTYGPDVDGDLRLRVLDYGTTFLLSWLRMITDRMSVEYRDEFERMSLEWSMARVDEARTALESNDLDLAATSRRLAYELSGHHVALVLARDGDREVSLETCIRELAASVSSARPLVAISDSNTAWCWIPTASANRATLKRRGLICGQGRPGHGIEGFRMSHREALEAVRVARLIPSRNRDVHHFEDLQLISLCTQDEQTTQEFVTSVLGELAAPTTLAQRLRETLGGFYASTCNFRTTAARLDLHHNTVRYRVTQAEAMLGRTYNDRRLETELALHVAACIGLPQR